MYWVLGFFIMFFSVFEFMILYGIFPDFSADLPILSILTILVIWKAYSNNERIHKLEEKLKK